jgi:hypothetical protein
VLAGSFGLWAAGAPFWVSLAWIVLLVALQSVLRPARRLVRSAADKKQRVHGPRRPRSTGREAKDVSDKGRPPQL